jgi:predicted HD superfamily hydrolase involved in NAD metabolism
MVLARDLFGVRDASILSAIRRHTVGDGQMSPMDALIYVSDFIEPGREPFPGLEKARKLAEKDIYKAMCCCAQLTAKHLKSQGKHVHPRSQALLDNYDK